MKPITGPDPDAEEDLVPSDREVLPEAEDDQILITTPVPDFQPPIERPAFVEPTEDWQPALNPTQRRAYESICRFILQHGAKGSGKSIGGLHALVRHCYEEEDALAIIIAPQVRSGKLGSIYDLQWVLDIWRNGNWADRECTIRKDSGIGLVYTEPLLDSNTKDRCLFIANRHGGWSQVILMSLPYAAVVSSRMKNLAPSFVYVEEITELKTGKGYTGREFFTFVAAQLGRRRKIRGPQQYYASCNPEGPSHWVYKVWFVECIDKKKYPNAADNRDPKYIDFFFPITENKQWLQPDYLDTLDSTFKDEMDRRRLLEGEWIDRPSGTAIFYGYFAESVHTRGDGLESGIIPLRGIPLVTGIDPGPKNFCISFLQPLYQTGTEDCVWTIFDELNYVGQYKPDWQVVPEFVRRIDFWNEVVGGSPNWYHIADEAAWTHMRQDGSYDVKEIQRLSKGRIRCRPCPKGKESVRDRVQMTMSKLMAQRIVVSKGYKAMDGSETIFLGCPKIRDMFLYLNSEKVSDDKYDPNRGLTPMRSPQLHPFDSITYPMRYFELHPTVVIGRAEKLKNRVYQAGG